jgi:predicted nucleotidyltransferase
MVTLKNIEAKIGGLVRGLDDAGYSPTRVILFGSYAKGFPKSSSDLDVAIWAEGFSGYPLLDIEKVASILRPLHPIELHPFHASETKEDNPFIEEIEKTGKDYSYLIAQSDPACKEVSI